MMADGVIGRPSHVGIVAGTAEGAALCYRMLSAYAETLLPPEVHPQLTVHAFPQSAYLALIDGNDWNGVAALMSRSATILARAGADLIVCPNNTLHRVFKLVDSPAPWLHIADIVAAETARLGYRRVGLLGTQTVMEGSMYAGKLEELGIELLVPGKEERIHIQRIIRTELIVGRRTHVSRADVSHIIAGLASTGAEAVILGCTELPLLFAEDHSALPLLDSTRLLAQAAIRQIGGRAPGSQTWPATVTSHLSHA
ncbi:MAG: amino acid racemase [Nitrospira sp.]|nr:amino acid racemase [Nitrospira sp.]